MKSSPSYENEVMSWETSILPQIYGDNEPQSTFSYIAGP